MLNLGQLELPPPIWAYALGSQNLDFDAECLKLSPMQESSPQLPVHLWSIMQVSMPSQYSFTLHTFWPHQRYTLWV